MHNILFIGTFFSKRTGTKSIAEKIQNSFSGKYKIKLVSSIKNKPLRLLHILITCVFFRGKTINIDVFSDNAFLIVSYASKILAKRNKKIILTLRGGKLPDFYKLKPENFKKVLQRATVTQTPSRYLQTFFKKQNIEVTYLPNPIHLQNFAYAPKPKPLHLLWVRAFTSIYNPEIPVKLVHQLKKEFPTIQLSMIGPNKGLQSKIEALIKELNLEKNITILGPIPNQELPQYYQNHTVFLNTTSYESFGTAVMEAAACGIPIVSTAVGEIPFLWTDKKNILLTKNITAEAFVEPVTQLLKSKKLCADIHKNAQEIVNTFDWHKIIKQWNNILTS